MRYRRSRNFPTRKRRNYRWVPSSRISWQVLAPGAVAGAALINWSLIADMTEPTMVRCVGQVHIAPPSTLLAADEFNGDWGIIKVPDVTLTTSDWNPETEGDKEWLMWKPWSFHASTGRAEYVSDIDTSVKRRVQRDEEFNFYISSNATSTGNVDWVCRFRFLFME